MDHTFSNILFVLYTIYRRFTTPSQAIVTPTVIQMKQQAPAPTIIQVKTQQQPPTVQVKTQQQKPPTVQVKTQQQKPPPTVQVKTQQQQPRTVQVKTQQSVTQVRKQQQKFPRLDKSKQINSNLPNISNQIPTGFSNQFTV